MDNPKRYAVVANGLRIAAGVAGAILLLFLYQRISGFGNAAIYAATWVTFLHICVGEFVFVRYLHANTPIQNAIDLMAGIFLAGGILSVASPPLWCALFGGLFALAIAKYLLVERVATEPTLKQYAREKVRWESPAVVGLVVTALVLDQLPPGSTAAHALQLVILVTTTAFAVWMIGIRHAYRRLTGASSVSGQ